MQQIPPQQEVRSRVSKETRVTNRHRHSDVSAVLRKSKQTSQVRQSVLRTLSPNRPFFCNHRTSKRRRRRESCRRCLRFPCSVVPPNSPGAYVFCTCICILLTLRMYQSKSGIEGCRVQYTYQIQRKNPGSSLSLKYTTK